MSVKDKSHRTINVHARTRPIWSTVPEPSVELMIGEDRGDASYLTPETARRLAQILFDKADCVESRDFDLPLK